MKENLLNFVIKVLVISALLYVVWSLGGKEIYISIIRSTAYVLFKVFAPGVRTFAAPSYGFSILIPFLSLAFATKTFSFTSKLYKTLIGIGAIIVWNSFLVFIWYFLHETVRETDTLSISQRTTLFFFSGILPFLLWAILFKDNLKKLFYPKKRKPARTAA